MEAVDTLDVITDVSVTSFVDTTLELEISYSYRVSALNTSGFAAESQAVSGRPLNPLQSDIRRLVFDSNTGSATLIWSQYAGPDFSSYLSHAQRGQIRV